MKAIIKRYEQLSKEFPGLGRPQALALSKEFSIEEIKYLIDYGFEQKDKSIWNVALTAGGFKKNGIVA